MHLQRIVYNQLRVNIGQTIMCVLFQTYVTLTQADFKTSHIDLGTMF